MRVFDRVIYTIKGKYARAKRAYNYWCCTLTRDDAQDMLLELQHYAGWYPLSTLCVEDVMFEYSIPEEHREYVDCACNRVSSKWENDYLSEAHAWAYSLSQEYIKESNGKAS